MARLWIKRIALGLLGLLIVALLWVWLNPPPILRVGASYAAKMVCSNVFLASRDAQTVLRDDVQTLGHPLLKYMRVTVDHERGEVHAALLGVVGKGLAVHRPGQGCAVVPDGDVAAARAAAPAAEAPTGAAPAPLKPPEPGAPPPNWPEVDIAPTSGQLAAVVNLPELQGPGMRAVVVVHKGRIVGETYGAGFGPDTPLLGWSMTKTATAALIGRRLHEGGLTLDTPLAPALGWQSGDPRAAITASQLLSMSSGLKFDESYGSVSDVTRMLYLEPDMAAFAAQQPLLQPPGTQFNYSSGSSLLLSRWWTQGANTDARRLLFVPLGMRSATLETDARGTPVGSSYLYATAKDWARLGLFLLNDGVWQGQRLLPEGYVARMTSASPAKPGSYGQGHLWLHGPQGATPEGQDPDVAQGLPADTWWMRGHDGQFMAVVPSQQLIVVRLGLTPSKLGYQPQGLVKKVLEAVR
ncbi:MAG: serine hydrolase [Ideonella sp.]|nr:serine hydrolase [Ideonella sp.]